ncbi:MAG: hypothetical protein SNG10_01290 [Rikenellaceae bacterium]
MLKLVVKKFRFGDEVMLLLMVSAGASIVLMSIYYSVKRAEDKILYTQTQINRAISQTQGGSSQKSIMDYIDENLPGFSSEQNSTPSNSELSSHVNRYANSSVRGLRIIRYIILIIEIIIQVLMFILLKNKGSQGGYSRKVNYQNREYYE